MVQRSWSNASAAAGHAPCVPAPKDPNFNVAPLGGTDYSDGATAPFTIERAAGTDGAGWSGRKARPCARAYFFFAFGSGAGAGSWSAMMN